MLFNFYFLKIFFIFPFLFHLLYTALFRLPSIFLYSLFFIPSLSFSYSYSVKMVLDPFVYSREALPSRVMILNQVMDALKGPFLHMIGVYGMGGIGKTTIAKEVYRQAVEEELFDFVVMVTVSQTPDIRRIQGEIADFLGLKFDVNEVPDGRASRLYKRLKSYKILIILDDIWTELDLRSVGIPFGDKLERSKILLTSRRKDVLCFEMGTQKDFLLDVLHEDEARSLFEMTMGEAKHPEFQAIASEVVERCAGLPLLVIIVATYLKNRESSARRDTLKKLFDFGNEELHGKVHKVLKSIYESLPSNEVKSFFLLCASFWEPNISVNHLLTYAMGLGLFGNITWLQDARERLFQMIENLVTESLLLAGDMNGYVKMHDVVLDVACSIDTKEQHAFYGISVKGFREWQSRDCTRIARPYCDIIEFSQSLEFPKANLFSLFSKDPYLRYSDLFFEGFREFKVLNLIDSLFMSLPTSLHFPTNLHSLHLHGCLLDDVTIIGELKQLEFLCFAESYIVELPKQIEQLSQLKLLDLTNCTQLKVFPANVLSKLSLLEELYMGNSFVNWDVDGNISVMELDELSHLTTLEIQVIDAKKMPNFLFSSGLKRYKICIGNEFYWGEENASSRWLKLRLKTSIHMDHGIKELLSGTEALYLDKVIGIENGLYDLVGKECRQLKHLHIQNHNVITHIIDSTMWAPVFPVLETLSLLNLNNLKEICHDQLAIRSFSKLRTLKVSGCRKLKNLFSYSSAIYLLQLQEMVMEYCDNMEAITSEGSEDGNYNNQVIFPNLTSLIVRKCGMLKYIFKSSTVKSLLQLKALLVENCYSMKEIILIEKSINKIVFPKLDFLRLADLPNLKKFSDGCSIEFQSLEKIEIGECHRLRNIESNISNRCDNCDIQSLFNNTVAFPNLQIMGFSKMENLEHIWYSQPTIDSLCKLKSLRIKSCRNLLVVFSANVVGRFQRLEDLDIYNCSKIEQIFQLCDLNFDDVAAFQLRCLELQCFPSLKYLTVKFCARLKNIAASSSVSFQNLMTLHVAHCDQLENLITISTAKTMVHLMELRITFCEMMKEIVANNGNDPEHEIIFDHLKYLELRYLPTLYSFCSGNYIFHFPLLEEVIVEDCLGMKIFCGGVLSSPKLRGVRHWKYKDDVQYWKGNLNATIASQCFRKKVLQNAYNWFVIEDSSSSNAISTDQLQFLNKLSHLYVRDCDSVQLAFDLEDLSVEGGRVLLPELRKLQLINLPKLSELWNKVPMRMFDFRRLRLLKVQNCSTLKYAFPQSMASSLFQLQNIEIKNCKMMEAIIKEEEAEKTKLPKLRLLKVQNCSSLKYAFTQSMASSLFELQKIEVENCTMMEAIIKEEEKKMPKIRLPSLKKSSIKGCPSMRDFMFPVLSREQNARLDEEEFTEQIIGMQERQEIVMPMLEELIIDWHIIKHKLNGNNQPYFSSKLKVIELAFPSNSFPTTEELVLSDFLVEEIIIDGLDNHHELLPRLRKIIFSKFPNLKHVVHDDDPRRVSVFQHLQVLQVWKCSKLKTLVPPFVYFQNLTFLQVSTCDGLINLISASTSKSLVQLKKMYVGRCKMIQEIVVGECDGKEDEIGFLQLEYLVLDDLPSLTSFCSSKKLFDFPRLEELFVIKCPNLKIFAQVLNTPKLSQIQTGEKEYEWEWEGSLNSTIHALFMERVPEIVRKDIG